MRRVYGFPAILLLVGAAALSAQPALALETVAVSLNDDPFEVSIKPSSVAAGAVDFEISNDGAGLPHNLRVIRTDLAPDALPVDGDTNMVDESQVDVVASSQDIAQDAMETVSATLPGGNYVLICNLPSHYLAGQYTAFSVTGQLPPTETPTATATPIPADTATPAPADTATPDGGAAAATATPATDVTQLPETGADDGSAGRWWPLAAGLGATGAALSGLGALATRRRWRGE
jgi:hypothetical protein